MPGRPSRRRANACRVAESKTADTMGRWIGQSHVIVATEGAAIIGVGAITSSARSTSNHARPLHVFAEGAKPSWQGSKPKPRRRELKPSRSTARRRRIGSIGPLASWKMGHPSKVLA